MTGDINFLTLGLELDYTNTYGLRCGEDDFFLNTKIMIWGYFMLQKFNSCQINFFVNQKRCLYFELDIHIMQETFFHQTIPAEI